MLYVNLQGFLLVFLVAGIKRPIRKFAIILQGFLFAFLVRKKWVSTVPPEVSSCCRIGGNRTLSGVHVLPD